MMEQTTGMQCKAAVSVRTPGLRIIAGYQAACRVIGDSREICVSARLCDEINKAMGDSRFSEMVRRFQTSGAQRGGSDSQISAMQGVFERGYAMSDMSKSGGMPGLNQAMMQYVPQARRAQIMQQTMGAMPGARR